MKERHVWLRPCLLACAVATMATLPAAAPHAAAATRVSRDLTARSPDSGAQGQAKLVVRRVKTGLDGSLLVVVRNLKAWTTYEVVVQGVRIGTLTTNGAGRGRARFLTRPRRHGQLLGVDPRGKRIAVHALSGSDELTGIVPESADRAGAVRCCVPEDEDETPECKSVTAEKCQARGGMNLGGGSCMPNPCPPPPPPPQKTRCCIPEHDEDHEEENEVECKQRMPDWCAKKSGVDIGPGRCDDRVCPPTPPPNRIQCCVPEDDENECKLLTPERCQARGGTSLGTGTCDPDPCPPRKIRCCEREEDEEEDEQEVECEQHTPERCAEEGGVNIGPGSCKPNPCAAVTTTTSSTTTTSTSTTTTSTTTSPTSTTSTTTTTTTTSTTTITQTTTTTSTTSTSTTTTSTTTTSTTSSTTSTTIATTSTTTTSTQTTTTTSASTSTTTTSTTTTSTTITTTSTTTTSTETTTTTSTTSTSTTTTSTTTTSTTSSTSTTTTTTSTSTTTAPTTTTSSTSTTTTTQPPPTSTTTTTSTTTSTATTTTIPLPFIPALAIASTSPTTVYAAAAPGPGCFTTTPPGALFKSTDGATSWRDVGSNFGVRGVLSLAIDPQSPMTLYAGTGCDVPQVFRTTDGGDTWQSILRLLAGSLPFPCVTQFGGFPLEVLALAVSPDGNTVYAVTPGCGVLKTVNALDPREVTWTQMNTGLPLDRFGNRTIVALTIDPLSPATVYAGGFGLLPDGTPVSVLKTIDGGGHWNPVPNGLTRCPGGGPPTTLALAIEATTTTLYAGTEFGVFKTTNGGMSWSDVSTGLPPSTPPFCPDGTTPLPRGIDALAVAPMDPDTVYAGFTFGNAGEVLVFKTSDGGQNWIETGLRASEGNNVRALAIDPLTPTTVYAGTLNRGVFKTVNSGTDWSEVNEGLSPP